MPCFGCRVDFRVFKVGQLTYCFSVCAVLKLPDAFCADKM